MFLYLLEVVDTFKTDENLRPFPWKKMEGSMAAQ